MIRRELLPADDYPEPGMDRSPAPRIPRVQPAPVDDFPATVQFEDSLRETGYGPLPGDEPEPESHTWTTIVVLLAALAAVLWLASQIRLPV